MFHPKGSDSSYAKLKHPALLYLQVNAHILSACAPTVIFFFFWLLLLSIQMCPCFTLIMVIKNRVIL